MNHTQFFAAVKAGDIKPCYLLEGTEEYIKRQAVARLCERLLPAGLEEMNRVTLANPEADALISAAETLPFMGEKRVVIVEDCDLLTAARKGDDSKLDALVEYLPHSSPTACVLFVVKGKADGRKKLYLELKKLDAIVDFSPMTDAECAMWAQKTLRAAGKLLDNPTAQQLVFTVGHDAALLRQEMDKLVAYAGDREAITGEDIDAVCVRSLECTVFQMVDAQVAGRSGEAFTLLQTMVRNGEDRIGILAMLLRQYRLLYHMRRLLDERVPQARQASLLGIPPFAVGRTQAQARRYPVERLKAAYDYLFELEYGLKSGRVSQEGCAEAALLKLNGLLLGA